MSTSIHNPLSSSNTSTPAHALADLAAALAPHNNNSAASNITHNGNSFNKIVDGVSVPMSLAEVKAIVLATPKKQMFKHVSLMPALFNTDNSFHSSYKECVIFPSDIAIRPVICSMLDVLQYANTVNLHISLPDANLLVSSISDLMAKHSAFLASTSGYTAPASSVLHAQAVLVKESVDNGVYCKSIGSVPVPEKYLQGWYDFLGTLSQLPDVNAQALVTLSPALQAWIKAVAV